MTISYYIQCKLKSNLLLFKPSFFMIIPGCWASRRAMMTTGHRRLIGDLGGTGTAARPNWSGSGRLGTNFGWWIPMKSHSIHNSHRCSDDFLSIPMSLIFYHEFPRLISHDFLRECIACTCGGPAGAAMEGRCHAACSSWSRNDDHRHRLLLVL